MKLPSVAQGIGRCLLFFAAIATAAAGTWADGSRHRSLELDNRFGEPAEVVRYYCERDASGFVWSGFLDVERQAFTTWDSSPNAEMFLVARSYEILPIAESHSSTRRVEVRYHGVIGTFDAAGTFIPSPGGDETRSIVFELRQVGGRWKIASPGPQDVLPVVLKDRLPASFLSGGGDASGNWSGE